MTVTSGTPAGRDEPPLTPETVYRALERFAPQARPYNYDDRFDCWGLVRAVYGALLPGRPLDDDLDAATADETQRASRWSPIVDLADLLPGDVVTTHDHHVPDEFHAVIFYGQVAARPLVYDSSPRGEIPLLEERDGALAYVDARELFTRYPRGTGGTDHLRDDGGAYLRLWFRGGRYYDRWLHDRLLEANPGRETDAVALRRRAGLALLPFYAVRRLETDGLGRERYDNRFTRTQNTYLPGDPPLSDDDYAGVVLDGGTAARRPAPPAIVAAPAAAHPGGAATIEWTCAGDDGAAGDPRRVADGPVDCCRIEVGELRRGVWKVPALAADVPPAGSFTVPAADLREDMCYEVAVFAHGPGGWSVDAGAWFVNRPAADNPFLAACTARPAGPAWSADEVGAERAADSPAAGPRDPRFRPRAGGHGG
ncbi:MAG TPA: fibronectin type III domain-containing protein [Thermoleophilia bacterium]|nr:fibronectin type III domain-containing protein [Thermoleophilia bacterium]